RAVDRVTESHGIIERAGLERIRRIAGRVPDRDRDAVTAIRRLGMDAAPRILLVLAVALRLTDLYALAQIHVVDHELDRRRLDELLAAHRGAAFQLTVV